MSRPAIVVENLGKEYKRGLQRARYKTFREALVNAVKAPLRRFKSLRGGGARDEWFWALRDVSFEVQPGEVVGLIGRNGAGKSTLLKILSRITSPTTGMARLRGRVGSLLEVGTGFHSELTGRENIYLNGAILGMKKTEIDRKFDEIVAFAEVEKFLDTPVKHYSSGMYVRLGFAVAANLEPDVLLIDEVLAVGDSAFQKRCLGKIGEVAGQGRTVIFVSHNIGAVASLCNRVVWLAEGRLRSAGPASTVTAEYESVVLSNEGESLDRLRPADYGKEIRFLRIDIAGAYGASLPFGEPMAFALTVQADMAAQDLSISGSLFTTSGFCLATWFSSVFSIGAHEERRLQLQVPNFNLAPGTYYAGFSIGRGGRNSGRHDFDLILGKPVLQILPLSLDNDHIASWGSHWGRIVLNSELTVEE